MPGKCIFCGVATKTKVNFTNDKGIRFEYYSCMKGKCAEQSIDKMFNASKKGGSSLEEPPRFEIDDEIKKIMSA